MRHMPDHTEFRETLHLWANAAWNVLRDEIRHVRSNPYRDVPRGGNAIGSWRPLPRFIWPEKLEAQLLFLPEWGAVIEASQRDEVIRRHLQEPVGTALGMRVVVLNEIAFSLWPTDRLVALWRAGRDMIEARDVAFDRVFESLAAFLESDSTEFIVLVPLAGLLHTHGTFELEPEVELGRFTDEELATLVERGVLRDRFGDPYSREQIPEHMRAGLRRRMRTRKVIGGTPDAAEGSRLGAQPAVDTLRIERALAATTDGRVAPQAFVAEQSGWVNGGMFTRWPASQSMPYDENLPKATLAANHSSVLAHAWAALADAEFEHGSGLRIPIDRLAGLAQRINDEDVIVDVAIAAEAFFRIPDAGPTRNNAHDRAQRAANWIDAADLGLDQHAVREFMIRAARMRNSIVHQGAPDLALLGSAGDATASLAGFAETFERLVRRAVRKAVLSDPRPTVPIW